MEILIYLLIGLVVGTIMAYIEGCDLGSQPVLMGFMGLFFWPFVISVGLIICLLIPIILPFVWIFKTASEKGQNADILEGNGD